MNQHQQSINGLIEQAEKSVVGQSHVIKALVIGMLTKGHVLLEGLPGTAKTRSIKTLATLLNASFGRIQFTPDLLPSDVTGSEVYQEFEGKPKLHFQPGPIFNSVVLADEVNRAPAKVQAALLEAMAEGTVTVGDQTHQLPPLFMVLATQNPVEQEGTYPLPEAQMDRFMMKVVVDYPTDQAELDIVRLVRQEELGEAMQSEQMQAFEPELVLQAREQVSQVAVSEVAENYMVALVMATRHPQRYQQSSLSQWIEIGASPRATIALDKASRAMAWLSGRDYVSIDDIREVAPMVLGHRVSLSYDALADGVDQLQVVQQLLEQVDIG